jgi:acetyltransferase-like isoleucine patch superfamily enzyme
MRNPWLGLKAFLHALRCGMRPIYWHFRLKSTFPDLSLGFPIRALWDDFTAIEIGRQVALGAFSEIIVFKRHPNSRVAGRLVIGDRCSIGAGANLRATGGVIVIGQNTIIGQHVSIIASNHTVRKGAVYRDLPWAEDRHGVVIADNVWIGAGVTILPGVSIGAGTVVAAGAVVRGEVPAGEIWGGVPARRIRVLR